MPRHTEPTSETADPWRDALQGCFRPTTWVSEIHTTDSCCTSGRRHIGHPRLPRLGDQAPVTVNRGRCPSSSCVHRLSVGGERPMSGPPKLSVTAPKLNLLDAAIRAPIPRIWHRGRRLCDVPPFAIDRRPARSYCDVVLRTVHVFPASGWLDWLGRRPGRLVRLVSVPQTRGGRGSPTPLRKGRT